MLPISKPFFETHPPEALSGAGDGIRAEWSGTICRRRAAYSAEVDALVKRADFYVYGRSNLAVEQINNTTGTVQYLHHDQAGSTRLITGTTGKTEATFTYGPYGELTGSTGTATTPLGYDAQYTSPDTGLIYLRNRTYDATTAQFLTVDPLEMCTGEPYGYAGDNPLNYGDPRGLAGESIGEDPSCPPGICFPFPNTKETERAIEAAKELGHEIGHGIESVWNEVTGEGESGNASTQTEQSSECGEAYTGDQDALIKLAKEANATDCHRKTRKCSENGPKSTTCRSVVTRDTPIALSGMNRTTKLDPRITSPRGDRSARRDR
jgi:RHS repeat-associated protein